MMNHHQQRTGLRMVYVHIVLLLGILFTTLMIEMIENTHHFQDAKNLGMIGSGIFYVGLQLLYPYNRSQVKLTPNWLIIHLSSIAIIIGFAHFLVVSPMLLLSFGVLIGLSQFVLVWYRLP